MGKFLDLGVAVLNEMGQEFGIWPDGTGLTCEVAMDNSKFRCCLMECQNPDGLVFYALAPWAVPPNKLDRMARFLNLANWNRTIGNLEMSPDGQELRLRLSVLGDCNEAQDCCELPKPGNLRFALFMGAAAFNACLPAIQAIIASDVSEAEAFAQLQAAIPAE
jgi:hypothetical protein